MFEESNFVLSWKNLVVSVAKSKNTVWNSKTQGKTILNEVSGEARNGTLVAIMGPSGAGKTTFLATLAGKICQDMKSRKNNHVFLLLFTIGGTPCDAGQLMINNQTLTDSEIKNISGYLHQHFVGTESLTIIEHLIFMSALKLNLKRGERRLIIKKIILELNLESCINTPVRNLSGGERKRLALAVELLDNPMILCCDEPTTGLDSTSANAVIEVLHEKALSGKLIIASIHQPSSQLYNYFGQIILLNRGELIFQGSKEETEAFFGSMNLKFPMPYNPADFYIQHINISNKNSHSLKHLEMCSKRFLENRRKCHSNGFVPGLPVNLLVGKRKKHLLRELYWLIWRNYIETKRNVGYHAAHFGLLVITAFMISTIYSDVKENDENSVQNYKGLLFFITSELIFTHLYAVIYTFPEEFNVFIREESIYSSYAYFISKLFGLIPRCIIQPFIFMLIVFLQVNFSSGFSLLLKMWIVLFLGCMSATALGLCISSVFQSLEFIELFIMPLDLLSMLLAGILLKIETIPSSLRWLKYSSPFYYVYESLSILQWNDVANITCSNITSLPCYKSGKEVLEELGFHTDSSEILINMLGMCLLSFIFCFVGYLGILRKSKQLL